jgi:hypothetical protein
MACLALDEADNQILGGARAARAPATSRPPEGIVKVTIFLSTA